MTKICWICCRLEQSREDIIRDIKVSSYCTSMVITLLMGMAEQSKLDGITSLAERSGHRALKCSCYFTWSLHSVIYLYHYSSVCISPISLLFTTNLSVSLPFLTLSPPFSLCPSPLSLCLPLSLCVSPLSLYVSSLSFYVSPLSIYVSSLSLYEITEKPCKMYGRPTINTKL